MNLQERLKQCNRDIAALEEEKKKLEKQVKNEKGPEFGDIVTFNDGFSTRHRVWLYDKEGKPKAFNGYGKVKGSLPDAYQQTGRNIFKILGLDD